MNFRTLRLAQLALVGAAFASVSMADVLPFQWSTTGTFSAPGLPSGLSFTGAPLSSVTNTNASGNLSGINLGSFNFSNIATDYTGTFTLTITFARPDGSADPVETVTLVADANSSGQNDSLTIDFPAAQPYDFTGTDGIGTFNFRVEDVSDFRNGSHTDTVDLIGDITGATLTRGTQSAVPEPASLLLLGSVLGGLAFGAKKKFSSNQ